jgi:NADH-quinone oxidoreductase subunit M
MIVDLLILFPLLTGLICFLYQSSSVAKSHALWSSIATLIIAVLCCTTNGTMNAHTQWLPMLGSSFSLSMDGMSKMLCLLTAIAFPIVFLSTYKNEYSKPNNFYGLMLLMQAGLMGVFLASDVLVFYFFWELALIPAYFLCSQWGGEKRIAVTFKFFIYTFVGSLIMLVGILFLYFKTPDHSFAIQSFYNLKLTQTQQYTGFWLFFIAFAIKMPIFPFHTWQPDTYEQSPTAVTMILSGVMVKMGLYGVIRFVLPIFPDAVSKFGHIVILFSVIGMLYASLIAIKQDDIKRLIAYSSIAHIGLMCAAIFTKEQSALDGVMIQMFNHGIVVIGLWIVADAIEQRLGTRKFSELGGLAQKAPALAILFAVMAFANIALPLTNSFIGEFLMFNGLFRYNFWMAAFAGISIILAAVYTLNMMQKIFFGNTVSITEKAVDGSLSVQLALIILVLVVVLLGIYPQPVLQLTHDTAKAVIAMVSR